jgi:C1A family cysteine protease
MANFKYGWKPDDYDPRDHQFKVSAPIQIQSVDLREKCSVPEIFNQENTSSCTGNSTSFHLTSNVLNHHVQSEVPIQLPFSRLFLYYGGRQAIGQENRDDGAQIRDVFKAVANLGACSEITWPFDANNVTEKPSGDSYAEAVKFKAVTYSRLNNNKQELVGCLLEGFSFVFGFSVFESFESQEVADTGEANLPSAHESCVGGHAVCCVGYDMDSDRFIVANSWGKEWGKDGYFTIPANYICDPKLASDFWVTKLLL